MDFKRVGIFILSLSSNLNENLARIAAFIILIKRLQILRNCIMYAIIANGGKQYKVSEGDIILLDCLNLEPKSKVEVSEVLAICDGGDIKLGAPYVSGAKVEIGRAHV